MARGLQCDVCFKRIKLRAVSVARGVHIENAERFLLKIACAALDVLRKQNEAGAGAESAHALLNASTQWLPQAIAVAQAAHHCAFAAGIISPSHPFSSSAERTGTTRDTPAQPSSILRCASKSPCSASTPIVIDVYNTV
jgi:hypothetical protein